MTTLTHDPYAAHPPPRPPVPALERHAATGPCDIVALVDRYPPRVNAGAEWMLHAMLRDSVQRGHRVSVVTGCSDDRYEIDGVQVFPVEHAGDVDAEVLVSHLAWTHHAIDLALGRSLPLLYIVHNEEQLAYWRIDRDKVSALVWNSERVATTRRADPEARGIPATIIRPPLIRADYTVETTREFVTLVNPILAKGADIFYGLARTDPGRRFLAVEGAYGSQVYPTDQDPNVVWQTQTGRIADDVYSRTRVLLMPSHAESWGRCAIEALCSGIPVIASPTPGLIEALGDAAIYADPHDLCGWQQALLTLDDPDVYSAAVETALARAAELEDISRDDLDRWDALLRLGAGTTRVRSGRMTQTIPYDPYSPHAAAPATTWVDATGALHTAEDPPALLGTGPTPAADLGGVQAPVVEPWEVPSGASAIVTALRQTADPDERRRRAGLVLAAEDTRPTRRVSVDRAVAEILGA